MAHQKERKYLKQPMEAQRKKQPNSPKRGKTRATKLRLVSVLHLIGGEWCEFSNPITEQIKAKTKQLRIILDSQLKIDRNVFLMNINILSRKMVMD